jgi:dihydroxy-acid dehydratase
MMEVQSKVRRYIMRSDLMKKGVERIPHRALMKATGLTDEELARPIIGIVNAHNEVIPGHIELNKIADAVKAGVRIADGTPIEFPTIGVCDGIAMNHEGMYFSLPSREHIADSVEIMAKAHPFDGLVFIPNCDKIVPGMLMAALRLNIPSIFCSGGPMLPGKINGESIALTDAFEVPGSISVGKRDEEYGRLIENNSCPGCGSCAGLFTANSMNCMTEILGMGLPGNGTIPAVYAERIRLAKFAGMKIMELIDKDIKPKDIVTADSFENAIVADMALGCSTNTILHLPAIAHEAGIKIPLEKINKISDQTPHLVKLNPAGKHFLVDLHEAGGLSALLKRLDGYGKLKRDVLTVTGKTIGENIFNSFVRDENVIRKRETAYSATGGLAILWGNICPDGSVVKKGAVIPEMMVHKGPAKCYDNEEDCIEGLKQGEVVDGDVVVIRYEGPKGGPGMREMLSPTATLAGMGLDKTCALITDGRFSGVSKGASIGHISPEAASGGLLRLIENGDIISIDIPNHKLELLVSEEILDERAKNYTYTEKKNISSFLRRYQKFVTSASEGAILSLD